MSSSSESSVPTCGGMKGVTGWGQLSMERVTRQQVQRSCTILGNAIPVNQSFQRIPNWSVPWQSCFASTLLFFSGTQNALVASRSAVAVLFCWLCRGWARDTFCGLLIRRSFWVFGNSLQTWPWSVGRNMNSHGIQSPKHPSTRLLICASKISVKC